MSRVFVLNKNIDTENNGIYFECCGVYISGLDAYAEMEKQYEDMLQTIKNDGDYDNIDWAITQITDMNAFIRVDVNSGDCFTWQIEEEDVIE